MKTKKFDCVEMKRKGAEIVQKKIKSMTVKQELEYWQKRTAEMKKKIAGQRVKYPQNPINAL